MLVQHSIRHELTLPHTLLVQWGAGRGLGLLQGKTMALREFLVGDEDKKV